MTQLVRGRPSSEIQIYLIRMSILHVDIATLPFLPLTPLELQLLEFARKSIKVNLHVCLKFPYLLIQFPSPSHQSSYHPLSLTH